MQYLTGSGWVERPTSIAPTLVGDASCDVVVVGGGLGGMAAALRFAALGVDVALVEADVCGWGASGRNAGYVTGTVGSDPRILKRFYADRVRGLVAFANNSVDFTEKLIATHALDCHYEQTGHFVAAVTARRLQHMRAAIKPGARTRVVSSQEAGVPPAFRGGLLVGSGGVLNPGELSLGVRNALLAETVRVFERSPVQRLHDTGHSVMVETAKGRIFAKKVLLTTNAFMNDLHLAPKRLSTPVRVTAVETGCVSAGQLDEAGWSSRTPIVTTHLVMESYRTTSHGTIVFTTRKLEQPIRRSHDTLPDRGVVEDLVRGFRQRFPTLRDVEPNRAWAGWIGMTPANLAVAGQAGPRVFYSMACNGHGLPQAPYLGHLAAEHIAGEPRHADLEVLWRSTPRFAPGVVNPLSLHLAWAADRVTDRLDRRAKV